MKNNLILLLIFGLNDALFHSEETNTVFTKDHEETTANPNKNTIDYKQGSKNDLKTLESVCYIGLERCHRLTQIEKRKQVCALHKIFKLVNFASSCEIALQNCLNKARESIGYSGKGAFHYNNANKPCQYYFKKSETLDGAIRLYTLDDQKYRKYFSEFEKVDQNNSYNIVETIPNNK